MPSHALKREAYIPNSEMKRPARMSQLCHDSCDPFTRNGQLKARMVDILSDSHAIHSIGGCHHASGRHFSFRIHCKANLDDSTCPAHA